MHKIDNERVTSRRQIRLWLGAGVTMILVQIFLGGITRLTGSGLSITEWKPLMGALPPLNHSEWLESFAHYREIAQFKKLNNHFTLSDYQALFFWEWLHREWARLMGIVFLLPFTFFLYKHKFEKGMFWPLAGLFILGAIQGIAGWLMVKSGLNETDVVVSHIRLAVHFGLGLVLLIYVYRIFLLQCPQRHPYLLNRKLRRLTLVILILLFIQMIYGAFMAGTHAALFAPTWPDINGRWFMMTRGIKGNWIYRITFDPLMIQFIHRSMGYLLAALVLIWFLTVRALPIDMPARRLRFFPPALVIIQVVIGVLTLHFSGTTQYIWIAAVHQLNGILLLMSLIRFVLSGTQAAKLKPSETDKS